MSFTSVHLDVCTLCQLDCPTCYMRRKKYAVGDGYLSFSNFKKFLDLNPQLESIELSNNGEVFLNPELLQIIELAHQRRVKLTIAGGVNFNTVTPEVLEGLVKYNVHDLNIGLDGASQETYSAYRRGGDFDQVIANIKQINQHKQHLGPEKYEPLLFWQYIILPSNDQISEIEKAIAMATELNMEICFKKDWSGYVPSKNLEKIEKLTHLNYSGGQIITNDSTVRFLPCRQLWQSLQINWDGRVFGCCSNNWCDLGVNAFEMSLEDCVQTPLVQNTMAMLMGKLPRQENQCRDCQVYLDMVAQNNFITPEELA